MPSRLHRYYGHGHLHFLTFSCYRRQALLTSPRRTLFLALLEQVRNHYRFVVAGYVIMPEHVHLLVGEPERADPSRVLQSLKLRLVRRVLKRSQRNCNQGLLWDPRPQHFWQHRFYDFNVWSQRKLREKLEYMHQNPVRRGLVATPDQWPWSSAGYYLHGEAGVVQLNEQFARSERCLMS